MTDNATGGSKPFHMHVTDTLFQIKKILKPKGPVAESDIAIDHAINIGAHALNDIHRIADALEKLTTFDFKRIGDVAIGKFAEPTPAPIYTGPAGSDNEPLTSQTERLAQYIIRNFPGEPSQNQGAIDTAIRLLEKSQAHKRELREHFKIPADVKIMDWLIGRDTVEPIKPHQPGSAEDFAAFLTVQPEAMTIGASHEVYPIFDAVKKYRERIDKPAEPA